MKRTDHEGQTATMWKEREQNESMKTEYCEWNSENKQKGRIRLKQNKINRNKNNKAKEELKQEQENDK